MLTPLSRPRTLKFAAVLGLALAGAACSSNKDMSGVAGLGAGGLGGAATPGSPQEFTVSVGDRVFFESDSTDLTPTAVATLDKQAQWLSRYPRYTFLIEGHADERGTREYNFSLGARRAQTVRDYLASRGVASSRIRTVSYGKEKQFCTEANEQCYQQNRRAGFTVDR